MQVQTEQRHLVGERAPNYFEPGVSYPVCSFHLSVDWGQSNDYTAISCLREEYGVKTPSSRDGGGWEEVWYPSDKRRLGVVYLERLPLHTSFVNMVDAVVRLIRSTWIEAKWLGSIHDKHQGWVHIATDHTGVGRGPTDMLRARGVRPLLPVTITAGGGKPTYHKADGDWHVPKRELVTSTQIAIQNGVLKISPGLPDAETVRAEMLNFRYSITPHAQEVYGLDWRREGEEGAHDDLLLSIAVGVFSANQAPEARRWANTLTQYKRNVYRP